MNTTYHNATYCNATYHNDTEKNPTIGCVILASGFSRRFGSNKLLIDFQGQPLISRILSVTDSASFSARIVVTRYPEIEALCLEKNIPVLQHTYPEQNDTIRLGLSALRKNARMAGCLFCVGDQPLLTSHSIETMLRTFSQLPASEQHTAILRLSYQKEPGNPVLFGSSYFEELLTLPVGKGGGFLAKKYPGKVQLVPARSKNELYDIDTVEDVRKLIPHFPK